MEKPQLHWYAPVNAPFVLEGFPFFEKERLYRRLSVNPAFKLPEGVESQSWDTSGGQIRFRARFKTLRLRARLAGAASNDHLTATGQCGFDLYFAAEGMPRYYSTTRFDHKADHYDVLMAELPEPQMLEVVINFPLYIGVHEVLLGFDAGAEIFPPSPRALPGRIVVYGTSITQGGCANRPGMEYTNILSRRLNTEVVNEGYSGAGCSEPEVAHAVADIDDPILYIHDSEANTPDYEVIAARFPRYMRIYRERHPETPILIVSQIPFSKELRHPAIRERRLRNKALQQTIVEQFRAEGDRNIYFLDGETLFPGDFEEYTVDGVHCTDLGFMHMADGLEPTIRRLLGL